MPEKPTVAHCANPFLTLTMVWCYDQIRALSRYRPVVLTQARQNERVFPVETLYSSEDLSSLRRSAYRVTRKIRGTYAGYGGILREERAAVIHAHFGQEGYFCLEARRSAGVPMVTTFYGMDASALPRKRLWRRRFQRLFREGELFLVEGPRMGESLVAIGCAYEKVHVHRLGVDLEKIRQARPDARREGVVLMYANFREKKGHVYGLRACRKLIGSHPGLTVRIIGDGELRAEVEREIRRLGIEDHVELLGVLPHATCLEELGRASVLLYPSVTAADGDTEGGAPVALIEAMASGLAIVSSLHADIPTVAPDRRCALLFPERNVDGLAEGVDALLRSSRLREEMGNAGRAHVEDAHDMRKQGGRLETLYDRVRA
ncbi:MAG: glycosyltransferase [Gemmatimonadota bacterium]|nr:glycosyltransferase [Gemmatimonadota bacterium]